MARKSNIRTQILDKAQEVFTRFGFGKTTMDDIARAMGKGKSSIYYYFTSKEEIFTAVIDKELESMRSRIVEAVSAKQDPRDQLNAYVLERMHGLQNFKNLYNVLRTEFFSQPGFAEQTRFRTDGEEITIMQGILDKGVNEGIFHLEDTYLTAIAIVTALKGMEIPLIIDEPGNGPPLENRLQRLIDVLFYGIVKREPDHE